MTNDDRNPFEPEHLRQWWETTRDYLFADLESLPVAPATHAEDGWSPPQTDSRGGRKRFIARVSGQLMRLTGYVEQDDPLRELEGVFQRQIMFIARHPDVPRHLLSWLAQEDDPGLRRRIRMLIGHYATRLARIIARAKQQGLVRVDVQPSAAAMSLVGVIQGLVLNTSAAPQSREWFVLKAEKAFALYRTALAVPAD